MVVMSFSVEIKGNWFPRQRVIPQNQAMIASAYFFADHIAGLIRFSQVPVVSTEIVRRWSRVYRHIVFFLPPLIFSAYGT